MPRVAVVGCGHWGFNLVRNFFQLGSLAFVVDSRADVSERVRQVAPGVRLLDELTPEALSLCDAVVIATPAPTHFELCRMCLLAGKDVYVEKPLALRLQDGLELTRLAEARGCILMVGHLLEYHDSFIRLLNMVRAGELGELRYLYSNRLSLGIIRFEEDVLWSLASHDVEIIMRLVGETPLTVSAQTVCQLQPGVADFATLQMSFPKGIGAHLFVSWMHPEKQQTLVVVGSRKTVAFDGISSELTVYDSNVSASGQIQRGVRTKIPSLGTEPLRTECEAFLAAVASRLPPITDGACGCSVLSVLETAHLAATSGRPEPLLQIELGLVD